MFKMLLKSLIPPNRSIQLGLHSSRKIEIKRLYELGKELNWNGSIDLDWSYNHPKDKPLVVENCLSHLTNNLDA